MSDAGAAYIRELADADIRRPLWEFAPHERETVASERRRRFPGVYETLEVDPEYH